MQDWLRREVDKFETSSGKPTSKVTRLRTQTADGDFEAQHSMQAWLQGEVARAEMAETQPHGDVEALRTTQAGEVARAEVAETLTHGGVEALRSTQTRQVARAKVAETQPPGDNDALRAMQAWLQVEVVRAEMDEPQPQTCAAQPTTTEAAPAVCCTQPLSPPSPTSPPAVPREDGQPLGQAKAIRSPIRRSYAYVHEDGQPLGQEKAIRSPIRRSYAHAHDDRTGQAVASECAPLSAQEWLRRHVLWAELTERSWDEGRALGVIPNGWPPSHGPPRTPPRTRRATKPTSATVCVAR